MWEKITSLILSSLIPATVISTQQLSPATPLTMDIEVEPLAVLKQEAQAVPRFEAAAVFVSDFKSSQVLFKDNFDTSRPIASITKLMTAQIVLEHFEKEELQTVVTVGKVNTVGSRMNLREGEEITIENLLRGLLIKSANDAAYVLADVTAGSTEGFVRLMNERKDALGMSNTHFVDPAGIDNENVSSPVDIARLAKLVFQDPLLYRLMMEKEARIVSADGKYVHHITNTNDLVGMDGFEVGKTGTSPKAGKCFVALMRGKTGRRILAVVLGSPDRFQEVVTLRNAVNEMYY